MPEKVIWEGKPSNYYYLFAYIFGGVLVFMGGLGIIIIVYVLLVLSHALIFG